MTDLIEDFRIDGMGLPEGGTTSGTGFIIDWSRAREIDILRAVMNHEKWLQSGITRVVPDPRVQSAMVCVVEAINLLRSYEAREHDEPRTKP